MEMEFVKYGEYSSINHCRRSLYNLQAQINSMTIHIPQSKKLRRNTEIMEQKKARWAEQEPRTMQLKKEHDAMYAELLKSYSQDELERLLSLPFDDLKKMDVSPESPKS